MLHLKFQNTCLKYAQNQRAKTFFVFFTENVLLNKSIFPYNFVKEWIGSSLEENEKRNHHSRKKRKEAGFSFGPLKLVKDIFGNNGPYGLARRNGNSELNLKILLKTPS